MRIATKTGNLIPKPLREDLMVINKHKSKEINKELDTTPEDALKKTYKGEDFASVKAEFDEYIKQKELKEEYLWFK